MNLYYSKTFRKKYRLLNSKSRDKVEERLNIFLKNQFDQVLNNHKLQGEYEGFRSINITGDIRIIYKMKSKNECHLHYIGTHSELYS